MSVQELSLQMQSPFFNALFSVFRFFLSLFGMEKLAEAMTLVLVHDHDEQGVPFLRKGTLVETTPTPGIFSFRFLNEGEEAPVGVEVGNGATNFCCPGGSTCLSK
jgi:hypothetical protein